MTSTICKKMIKFVNTIIPIKKIFKEQLEQKVKWHKTVDATNSDK